MNNHDLAALILITLVTDEAPLVTEYELITRLQPESPTVLVDLLHEMTAHGLLNCYDRGHCATVAGHAAHRILAP